MTVRFTLLLFASLLLHIDAADDRRIVGVDLTQDNAVALLQERLRERLPEIIKRSVGTAILDQKHEPERISKFLSPFDKCLARSKLSGIEMGKLEHDLAEVVASSLNFLSAPIEEMEKRLKVMTSGMEVTPPKALTAQEESVIKEHEETVNLVVAGIRKRLNAATWTLAPGYMPKFVHEKAKALNLSGTNYDVLESLYLRQLVEDSLTSAEDFNRNILPKMTENLLYASQAKAMLVLYKRKSLMLIDEAIETALPITSVKNDAGHSILQFKDIPGEISAWVAISINNSYVKSASP